MRKIMTVLCIIASLALSRLVSAGSSKTIQVTNDGHSVAAAFSPDGTKVAYASVGMRMNSGKHSFQTKVGVWDGKCGKTIAKLDDTLVRPEFHPNNGRFRGLRWLSGGRYLLVGYDKDRMYLVRVSDGNVARIKANGDRLAGSDWAKLSAAETHAMKQALDESAGPSKRLGNVVANRPDIHRRYSKELDLMLRMSPTNAHQALFATGDELVVIDTSTGRYNRIARSRPIADDVSLLIGDDDAAWSPDGRTIAYKMSNDPLDDPLPNVELLYVVHPDGSGNRSLPVRDVLDFKWLDARRLVVTTHHGELFDDKIPEQLSIVDTENRVARQITGGKFQHELMDAKGDKYLVVQRQPGLPETKWVSGDIFIIQAR
ncbi:MAG TPA: hypothetical protein VGK34_08365 [Armatimonadota bacterium]